MKVIEKKLQEIREYANNPRINDNAVDKVAESIKSFGFNVPILIDLDGVIVAGTTRYKAAQKLGLKSVPCIVLDDLNEDKIRQYRIVDNKTAELSSWDYDKLIIELDAIPEIDMSAFDFGNFRGGSEEGQERKTNLDEGFELDLSDFEDEAFNIECPYCGFRWNE